MGLLDIPYDHSGSQAQNLPYEPGEDLIGMASRVTFPDKIYDVEQVCDNPIARRPNLRESLVRELQQAKANVSRLEELLGLLEKNPEVNRIMELLRTKGCY